jgi:hypothetical protein
MKTQTAGLMFLLAMLGVAPIVAGSEAKPTPSPTADGAPMATCFAKSAHLTARQRERLALVVDEARGRLDGFAQKQHRVSKSDMESILSAARAQASGFLDEKQLERYASLDDLILFYRGMQNLDDLQKILMRGTDELIERLCGKK